MKYLNKQIEILDLASEKKVLHLGCVGFADSLTLDRVDLINNSLHAALSKVANVTGVDSSAEVVAHLAARGLFNNIVVGNVENLGDLNIDKKFDVIVAGDIIEHLSNPGLFLNGLKKFFHSSSVLVITTPNAFGLLNFVRFLLNKFVEGREHVMTFNAQNIIQLLERHDYCVTQLDTCFQPAAVRYGRLFVFGKALFTIFPKWGGTLFVVATDKSCSAQARE